MSSDSNITGDNSPPEVPLPERQMERLGLAAYGCLGCLSIMTLPFRLIFFVMDLPRTVRHRFRKRAFPTGHTIEEGSFPILTWDEFDHWTGECCLPEWAGFQSRGGGYGARDSRDPTDGTMRLEVEPLDRRKDGMPTTAQKNTFDFILRNGDQIVESALNEIFQYLQKATSQEWFEFYEGLPKLREQSQLRKMIGPHSLHIHSNPTEGMSYFGLEFGCIYDEENGLGVLMHGHDVIEVGPADVAFSMYEAEP